MSSTTETAQQRAADQDRKMTRRRWWQVPMGVQALLAMVIGASTICVRPHAKTTNSASAKANTGAPEASEQLRRGAQRSAFGGGRGGG